MRRYSTADEEAIRTARRVRDWTESRLLDPEHAKAIELELRTGLRRTNRALRAVLSLFAGFVVLAAVGLVFALTSPDGEAAAAGILLAGGIGSFLVADILIARFDLYRFGVEEACAVCAVVLVAAGVGFAMSAAHFTADALVLSALLSAAVAGVIVYLRFGLLYCALAAGAGAASAPFFIGQSEMWARVLAAVVLFAIHIVAGRLRQPLDDDYPGDDFGVIESSAWLGLFVVLNLKLPLNFLGVQPSVPRSFYWATYVLLWVLPIVGLYRGVRTKHRWMIRASVLMALGTIVTNKPYLGWAQHTWDPILLGLLLIGSALAVRRWLSLGTEGQRRGFTAQRLLSSDSQSVSQVALATTLIKPDEAVREGGGSDDYTPGGGASGGAGAGGRF
jgi:hypothetical protein